VSESEGLAILESLEPRKRLPLELLIVGAAMEFDYTLSTKPNIDRVTERVAKVLKLDMPASRRQLESVITEVLKQHATP